MLAKKVDTIQTQVHEIGLPINPIEIIERNFGHKTNEARKGLD